MSRLNYFKTKPKVSSIDVSAYLKRIGQKKEAASPDYLKKLHAAHIHSIPFENLDIHYGRKIILDYQQVFKKVVSEQRGGFCYELNGLFYHLLHHLNFDCYLSSAKVANDEGELGPPFDHMVVIVVFNDEHYLVDVGFGDAFLFPKKIMEGEVQMDHITYWRMDKDANENLLMKRSSDNASYKTVYQFDLAEKQVIEFMGMCEYHQTSEKSPFTKKKMITIKTGEGRITLTDRQLKIQALGELSETDILNEDEFLSKLDQYFGITRQQLNALAK